MTIKNNASRRARRCSLGLRALLATAALLMPVLVVESPALACNTRDGADSYMNTTRNLNSTPGNAWYYSVDAGTKVWMDGWNGGPYSMGQYKWFHITVRSGPRYGLPGWVPAPSVSNQWTCSPYYPY